MKKLILLCTTAAATFPTAAYAQSTGTQETEKDTIVITGTRRQPGTAGVVVQDSTKAKGLITQELISKQNPGQSVLSSINIIPGVNFTQNDPYGSSGGNIRIRGFDGNRISLTLNGAQLNDSGNYAIFSNQQVDPELIEQVNVNLGATDVDSPTASAAGGTVNLRTALPTRDQQVRIALSGGSFDFRRLFMQINTGDLTASGLRAWVSGSRTNYDHWRGDGTIQKTQFNAKVYQPLGTQGDFVTLNAHYNENRNNNYNNPTLSDLRSIFGTTDVPATYANRPTVVGNYNEQQWDRLDQLSFPKNCLAANGTIQTRPTPVQGTAQSDPSTCFTPEGPLASQGIANKLSGQINPSNTGNIGLQSRFTLGQGLILTVDPTYQYTLANGGSQTALIAENSYLLAQGQPAGGVDLNGDNDILDTVVLGRPSITNTNRFTLVSSLVFRPSTAHTFRLSYTFDRARHRQTGEYSYTDQNFRLDNPFFGRNGRPVITAAGTVLQNRDRLSIALLNQLSGQYIGRFIDNRLRVELGLRSPWFQRNLDQRCFTPAAGSGFPDCLVSTAVSTNGPNSGRYVVPNSYAPPAAGLLGTPEYAPFKAKYKFHKLLPNVGATFAVTDAISIFSSYSKGFSAPRTDNLYRQPFINITPESTNSYDFGARYVSRALQIEATAWKIDYKNRIVSSFDPITNVSIDRNVGKVKSSGFDASVGTRVAPFLNLIGNVSYTKARLQSDLIIGAFNYVPVAIPAVIDPVTGQPTTVAIPRNVTIPTSITGLTYICNGLPSPLPTASGVYTYNVCARTAGKQVVETPKWQVGGRAEFSFNPVTFGIQAKYVGKRFATDVNDVVSAAYTFVDLDARVGLPMIANKRSYVQFNLNNLFNARYFGNLSTQINAYGFNAQAPRFTPVATRSAMLTLNIGL
ncbi:TonB-dependent receptor [Sphingomonas rosea]|uniref:TonB-dependent receptor n=1 Tax=Sphingomonas rosea TaxID=335605 RepID=A0ABP7UH96_9SPHN